MYSDSTLLPEIILFLRASESIEEKIPFLSYNAIYSLAKYKMGIEQWLVGVENWDHGASQLETVGPWENLWKCRGTVEGMPRDAELRKQSEPCGNWGTARNCCGKNTRKQETVLN